MLVSCKFYLLDAFVGKSGTGCSAQVKSADFLGKQYASGQGQQMVMGKERLP
jgi:hypothetical protein